MSQEYRIPDGLHNPGIQTGSVRDEINQIFQNQSAEPSKVSREISPTISGLIKIGESIADARKYRLDTQFFHKNEGTEGFIRSTARFLFGRDISVARLQSLTEDHLRTKESEVTANLFTPRQLPDNLVEYLSLFNYDRNNWYFHQVVIDTKAKTTAEVTLHYEIHPEGVLKVSSRPETPNGFINGEELEGFVMATDVYHQRVLSEIYGKDSQTYIISRPPIPGTDENQLAA